MHELIKRLSALTADIFTYDDETSESYQSVRAQAALVTDLLKVWRTYEALKVELPSKDLKVRIDGVTRLTMTMKHTTATEDVATVTDEVKKLATALSMWAAVGQVDVELESAERDAERKSAREWNKGGLTTAIKLTEKQNDFLTKVNSEYYSRILALGGSGSGKSFVQAYKVISDALEYKAPCLIARAAMIDLQQGMIDQIIPTVLQKIAEANGVSDWKKWRIDGLQFAKWTDKKTRLDFATGGYIRVAGLSARDNSDAGGDKILSPSWFHIMCEEISELDYDIIEKLLTRLRYSVPGVRNKMFLCENPPSINHWSYKRYVNGKREDGTTLSTKEAETMFWMLMNPQDNVENLGEDYIETLSQLTGDNYERFFLGKFQESRTGEIFKKIQWYDQAPPSYDWDRLILYCDPTPLTTKDHSVYADYKATLLVGMWNGNYYMINAKLVRGSTSDMLMAIKEVYDSSPDRHKTEIWMENKGVPSDFKEVWKVFSVTHNFFIPIQRDKRNMGDKKAFIETILEPEFREKRIFINLELKEREEQIEYQILSFSRKTNKFVHDDVPDALARAVSKISGKKLKNWQTGEFGGRVLFTRPKSVRIGG